jgi:hypothetical protein
LTTVRRRAATILLRADDLSVFPVKRDGALVGVDLPALMARLLESRDRIAAAADIRVW